MGLAGGNLPHPRALLFDLDRCLIDSRNAWRYCIEESIAAARGTRVDASSLVDEYHTRPWRDALSILATSAEEERRCAELCAIMFERSAMKRLLVHEGVGMALDSLRGQRIELGAISRLHHGLAVKQVQSTGLDRFLAVVATTPLGEPWDPAARISQCLTFLEADPARAALISGDTLDRAAAERQGLRTYSAAWAAGTNEEDSSEAISAPSGVLERVIRDWSRFGDGPTP